MARESLNSKNLASYVLYGDFCDFVWPCRGPLAARSRPSNVQFQNAFVFYMARSTLTSWTISVQPAAQSDTLDGQMSARGTFVQFWIGKWAQIAKAELKPKLFDTSFNLACQLIHFVAASYWNGAKFGRFSDRTFWKFWKNIKNLKFVHFSNLNFVVHWIFGNFDFRFQPHKPHLST